MLSIFVFGRQGVAQVRACTEKAQRGRKATGFKVSARASIPQKSNYFRIGLDSETVSYKHWKWVLDGETVQYASAYSIMDTLEHDITQERSFSYEGLSIDQSISHICRYVHYS